ncbi:DUF5610 domain-containing protein [Chromobacterium vaccinii]|uniref:DUF5610 domain-containing protein n=1 Tax=Chromobacterium vaccinii TaxID=1108595 RepID=UPI003C75F130
MAAIDDIIIHAIGATQPRQGGDGGLRDLGHAAGRAGQLPLPDDDADIQLSHGHQAAELLYSATMDQVARLAGLELDAALLQEGALPMVSHSQHLLLGVSALFERYCAAHPQAAQSDAQRAFAPLAQAGLEHGYRETCQVLRQLKAYSPTTAAQLLGLFMLSARLLRERLST